MISLILLKWLIFLTTSIKKETRVDLADNGNLKTQEAYNNTVSRSSKIKSEMLNNIKENLIFEQLG